MEWGATKHFNELRESLKLEIVGTLEINGPPTEENVRQIMEIGKLLAKKIIEES